ncbi:MAG: phosphoribosyltransferase family protein [Balneolales bacterium]
MAISFSLGKDVFELIYPVTCLVCGDRVGEDSQLCTYCLKYAFEPANAGGMESCDGIILPDWIVMQDSLWEFDKGGFLQDILHYAKYNGFASLCVVLGRELGYKIRYNRWLDSRRSVILLPVPLHPARQRKRGYNQSAKIAEGIAEVTGSAVADSKSVVRVRNTRTQTGLNSTLRWENTLNAFSLNRGEVFNGQTVLIVDDIITTGATTLELAKIVRDHCASVGIVTVARA